ncbi:MAG TPA: hypothetical protein VFR41_03875 [Acidimicrobiia bacterium]|nr:hypothetical protein [Acidimicrobiia bacterium]
MVEHIVRERGFVAIEWVAAVALLLLPTVLLVAELPTWAERGHAATVAAREAVRVLVDEWPNAQVQDVQEVAREVAADHGVDDVSVSVPAMNVARGEYVRVRVTVALPGGFPYTASAARRIDDYRSR